MRAKPSSAIDRLFTFLSLARRVGYISWRHANWVRKRRHREIPSFLLATFSLSTCYLTFRICAVTSGNDRCRTTEVAGRRAAEGAGAAAGADPEVAVRHGRAAADVDRRGAKQQQQPRLMPAVDRTADLRAGDYNSQTPQDAQTQPAPPAEELTLEQQEEQQGELERGPEIADPKPDTPALNLGPAKLRVLGYPSMTMLWRSTNSGGNVGTSFASLPFGNAWQGNTSEFRISPQSTRLALRADLSVGDTKAAGYFEMDFGGSPNPGNVAVTSSSYSFRLRQAFFNWVPGKWDLTGGQAFSLMTPLKKGITPWPGDVATTQVVDTNYVAGLVWGRYPQIRIAHAPYKGFWWGFSIENPEQQVGNNVVFPANLNSIVSNQYNTGSQELKVPNMTPDFVFKGAFDSKM